jgi:TrmH family RNA methyltransferase
MVVISSRSNDFIIEICKLKQKKYRNRKGLFYTEGFKLFKEALNSEYREKIKYIIAEESIADRKDIINISETAELILVTTDVYRKITDEEAFEGIMCVIEKPETSPGLTYEKPVIILSSVRDPGNVGAVIRTADAVNFGLFGSVDIIISDDCADIYSGKTQRAAMGSIFRQNIKISKNIQEDIANLKKNGYNIFAAHLDKDSCLIDDIKFNAKTAVVFGNEGSGLDGEIIKMCDEKMIIPINQKSESLNVSVAAAIVLWEMRKNYKNLN